METKEQVLQACTVHGTVVKLPNGQLERKLYQDVAKALELIGGKWKGGKVSGFEFTLDPTELLAQIATGDQRNLKKEYQFFATPPEIADWLVQLAEIKPGHKILEPSAGQGAIVGSILKVLPGLEKVDCCELMPTNKIILNKNFGIKAFQIQDDFLAYYNGRDYYHRIIANPPFAKNQDIDHIRKMHECLAPGGRLVSIASNHWKLSSNKKESDFRQWLDELGASTYDIEPGKFKESGTMIGMQVVVIDKPDGKPDVRNSTPEQWLKWVKEMPFSEVSFPDFLRATTSQWDDPEHKHIITYFFDGKEIVSFASNAEPDQAPLRHWYNDKVAECLNPPKQPEVKISKPQKLSPMKTNPKLLRTFQSFATVRHSIPILDNVMIRDGIATISDLETWIQFPVDKPDGYYDLRMNELFFMGELNDDYPLLKLKDPHSTADIQASIIVKYAPCVAVDQLRPTMQSIFLTSKEIVATDAHQLLYNSWDKEIGDAEFTALFNPTKPLIARCKQDKSEIITIEKRVTLDDQFSYVGFVFEDCTIMIRETEGKFPDYQSVIPKWNALELNCFSITSDQAREMAKTAKSFKGIAMVVIGEKNMCIQNIDMKLEKNWGAPLLTPRPKREPDGLLMPRMGTDPEKTIVCFDPIKLASMLTDFDGNVIIGVHDPARCMAIWLGRANSVEGELGRRFIPKQEPAPTPVPIPTPKAAAPKQEVKTEPEQPVPHKLIPRKSPLPTEITIVTYSEKAIAVFGDTKRHKDKMKEMFGSFNPHLKFENQPTPGWIFSKKREAQLRELFES